MLGWGYAQNAQILSRAEAIPQKHQFMSLLAATIVARQTQMILIFIPFQNQHVGITICAKH